MGVWIGEYGYVGGDLGGIVGFNSIGDTQRHMMDLLL
jgi:hypothetical protein